MFVRLICGHYIEIGKSRYAACCCIRKFTNSIMHSKHVRISLMAVSQMVIGTIYCIQQIELFRCKWNLVLLCVIITKTTPFRQTNINKYNDLFQCVWCIYFIFNLLLKIQYKVNRQLTLLITNLICLSMALQYMGIPVS